MPRSTLERQSSVTRTDGWSVVGGPRTVPSSDTAKVDHSRLQRYTAGRSSITIVAVLGR